MAYIIKRYGNKIYGYTYRDGKVVAIPRLETKHLDGTSESSIKAWLTNYELTVEKRHKASIPSLHIPDVLKRLLDKYVDYLQALDRSPITIQQHEYMMNTWIFPFFVGKELCDPHQWPGVSYQLKAYLTDKEASSSTIRLCNAALRGFWDFHTKEMRIQSSVPLHLHGANMSRKNSKTPLPRVIQPIEVLRFVEKCSDRDVKFMALLGYFFSLRPQETFYLERKHFFAGSKASQFECCRTLAEFGLFDKLAVDIEFQKTPHKAKADCKKGSNGIVACFNQDAAKLLIELLKPLGSSDALLPKTVGYYTRKWKVQGIKGITLKDLRRASIYWLGHDGKLSYAALRNHARHTDPTTTALYLRRPEETAKGYDSDLDLTA
jgi:integrase